MLKKYVPDKIKFKLSRIYISFYVRILTWYNYGRNYDTNIDSFEIINIDPSNVEEFLLVEARSSFERSDAFTEIAPGSWDKQTISFKEYDLCKSFVNHFQHDEPWSNTEFYHRVKDSINSGNKKWGCSNMKQFEERLSEIDDLYESMQSKGYRRQKYLRKNAESDILVRDIHKYWPPIFHEISVVIGRDGNIILYEGRHRFTIAKILNINNIPVRIRARHEQWQKIREEHNKRNQPANKSLKDHPDLINI